MVAAWLFASARTGDIKQRQSDIHCHIRHHCRPPASAARCRDVRRNIGGLVCQFFWRASALLGSLAYHRWRGALVAAYFTLHHVASRIDRFLDPSSGDSYQVDRSLEAFINGGLFGRGPGEGTVKEVLNAHSDFVFAVAGEEFGLFVCLIIVGLFAFIVLSRVCPGVQETDLFILLATAGLLVQFGLQAVINMGSTLRLMPNQGNDAAVCFYGGSSLIAMGLCIGFLLALTRKRVGAESQR